MRENKFQAKVIKRIKQDFPKSIVLKNDPNYIQGIPDLLILNEGHWAALEVKRSAKERRQPNQDYYVNKMNDMSYAAFICPSNEEVVFSELQSTFGFERQTRISESE